MTGDELKTWASKHGHTLVTLAHTLEISERQLRRYAAGEWPVPRVVELALDGLGRSERARRAARARWDRRG